MQASLSAYRVPAVQVEATRAARLAQDAQRNEMMKAEALRAGLPWPQPPGKRSRGAPSKQTKWESALYARLQEHGDLPETVTRLRPTWWEGGPLVMDQAGADGVTDCLNAAAEEEGVAAVRSTWLAMRRGSSSSDISILWKRPRSGTSNNS